MEYVFNCQGMVSYSTWRGKHDTNLKPIGSTRDSQGLWVGYFSETCSAPLARVLPLNSSIKVSDFALACDPFYSGLNGILSLGL